MIASAVATFIAFALTLAIVCPILVRRWNRLDERRFLTEQGLAARIGLQRVVEPPIDKERRLPGLLALLVVGGLSLAFIGWLAQRADDIRRLERRVEQLEKGER